MAGVRILQIILGLAMLVLGRRLFWLFVGSMGFITATEYAITTMPDQPEWAVVLIGLVAGIIGALLAIYFQVGAIALSGILGGGFLGLLVARSFNASSQLAHTLFYVIGAIIGLLLFLLLFDSALIAVSAFAGSYLLVQQLDLVGVFFWLALVVVALLGVGVQVKQEGSAPIAASA